MARRAATGGALSRRRRRRGVLRTFPPPISCVIRSSPGSWRLTICTNRPPKPAGPESPKRNGNEPMAFRCRAGHRACGFHCRGRTDVAGRRRGDWSGPARRRLALSAAPADRRARQKRPAISVLLAGDERLRALNGDFRQRRNTTNVLSFPSVPQALPYLGDVALGYGVLCREAQAQNKSLAAHAAHLTNSRDFAPVGLMTTKAQKTPNHGNAGDSLLAGLDIPDPYLLVPVRRGAKRSKIAACPRIPAR